MDLVAASTGGASDALPLAVAFDAFTYGLEQLAKSVSDGGLRNLDKTGLVTFMQAFEQARNRLPLIDHGIIKQAEQMDLAHELCQGSIGRVLTCMLRICKSEAARRVRAAKAVGPRTSQLGVLLEPTRPLLAAGQQSGTLSPEHVDIIGRAVNAVDRGGFDPDDIAAGEQILTGHAMTFSPEDLRLLATRVVDAINPDGTLPDDQLNEHRRHLHLRPTEDGAYAGEFRLSGSLGAKLTTLLDPLAKIRPPVLGPDGIIADTDTRIHGQRMHDALEDLCDRLLRTDDTVPDTGGIPATVIVTISLEDLLDQLGYGRTADGTVIPTAKVLELAEQADIIPTVLNASGAVLEQGRSHPSANPRPLCPRFGLQLSRLCASPTILRKTPRGSPGSTADSPTSTT